MSIRTTGRIAGMVAAVALMVAPLAASAGSSTGTLTVQASVSQNCTVSSPTLNFGAYDPVTTNLTAPLDQNATITLTCTKGATGVTLGFGASPNTANCAVLARCMKNGSDYLDYEIYSDSPGGTIWTTPIAEDYTGKSVSSPLDITVYGEIPGGQDAAAGASYADSLVATVNF